MTTNIGKDWENIFKRNWERCFPKSVLIRLKDQMSKYKKASRNPCDFIGFLEKRLFLIECKSVKINTLNFSDFPQYERLLDYKDKENCYCGVIIWYYGNANRIVYVPLESILKIKNDGNKSINITKLDDYEYVDIPFVLKRNRPVCDFNPILEAYQDRINYDR